MDIDKHRLYCGALVLLLSAVSGCGEAGGGSRSADAQPNPSESPSSTFEVVQAGPDVVRLRGEIDDTAPRVIEDAVQSGRIRPSGHIELDSPGGDVRAAMDIGRMLRRLDVYVEIPNEAVCASSCVLLYAAGTQRSFFRDAGMANGPIIIHRPFFPDAKSATFGEVQRGYNQIEQEVKGYLVEMNVNPDLWDRMMQIPSDSGEALSVEQLNAFGMGVVDPVKAELNAQREAERYGVTRETYNQRKPIADSYCRIDSPDFAACRDRVFATGSP